MKEAIIYLHDECNYSCSYCLLNQPWYTRQTTSRAWTEQGLEQLADFFKGWTLMLTGGEPTYNRRFMELASRLAANNILRLDTNNSLSLTQWREFDDLVGPEKVDWIHCSLHPVDLPNLESWLDKLVFLQQGGYRPWVSWVAVPEEMVQLPKLVETAGGKGIPFVPTLLRTDKYPAAYTAGERELFDKYSTSAIQRGMLDLNVRNSKGQPCPGGERRIQVNAITGNIYRCFRDNQCLGNIYAGDQFTLTELPAPCPWDSCTYYFEHQLGTEEIFRRDMKHILAGNTSYDQELYRHYLAQARG